MEKVIVKKVISEDGRLDRNGIITRMICIMYSDYTWEEFELKYIPKGKHSWSMTYPKTFRPQNMQDKKMTKEEARKYIEDFKTMEGL